VRAFDNTATTDDTTAISSYVLLGPILTKMMDNMMLRRIVAILGAESGNVNYEVYVGDTAAAALASSRVYPGPNDTATFGAGRNVLANIRRSGHVVWIKLLSTVPWAFEQMNAEVFSRGALERRRLQS
jgi:glycerol kinase